MEGTRTAILIEIETWEVDYKVNSVYWLRGVAGCGKSTIAQTFAERSATNGRLGASFFCSLDFADRRNLHLTFPTLAHNIAYQHSPFRRALVPLIRSSPHIEHDSLAVQCEKLLIRPLKSIGLCITIIIDALDECEDKEYVSEFLSVLAQYVDEIPFVKIFITGRPEDHIRSGFAIPSLQTRELPLHDVDSATVDSDIELYVRNRLQEIAMRRRFCINGPWPLEKDIATIIWKSSGFFIIASIIIDFIDDPHDMPQDRLELIVSMPNSTIYEGMSRMDVVYHQILLASFKSVHKDDPEPFNLFRLVVASILLAFNPLSRTSLARILGISSEKVWMSLLHLHSVFVVPESDTRPIRICHKSLADFLTDAQRCRDPKFHIDVPTHHLCFGIRCLDLMNTTLKKNICRLPRYAMNSDVEDLSTLRENYDGIPLAYACQSWANHLRSSAGSGYDADIIVGPVNIFLENQFLSWLEVLSIEGNLLVAVYSLRNAKLWLTDVSFYT
jgi:NACHT domain